MTKYIEIVEIRETEKFVKDVLKEKGYIHHANNFYDVSLNSFAKLKLKHTSDELSKILKDKIIFIQDIPRHDKVLVKYAKKYGLRVFLTKKGTKYKIDSVNSYRGYSEKITFEHEIDWKIA